MDERILQQIAGALDLWYPSRAIPGCRLGSMCPEKFLAQQGPAALGMEVGQYQLFLVNALADFGVRSRHVARRGEFIGSHVFRFT
jgi:hypothetical protein